jgi:hypothetical protein
MKVGPTPPSSPPTSVLSASAQAGRIVEIQRKLGVDMHYSMPSLESGLASNRVSESCRRANDDKFHRDEIAVSYQQPRESVDHWTRVKAGWIAGVCPAYLHSFLSSLDRLGYRSVTDDVSGELRQLGIAT